MQFDMYHHYTVDEHTIRAIGLLADIEQNRLKEDHPLSTVIMDQIHSRRVIYCAVLLHDIAKGRGGDHSVLGAELALRVCPRLGLSRSEEHTSELQSLMRSSYAVVCLQKHIRTQAPNIQIIYLH